MSIGVFEFVLGLVVLHFARRRFYGHETDHGAWFAPAIGVLAGFTTLVAKLDFSSVFSDSNYKSSIS